MCSTPGSTVSPTICSVLDVRLVSTMHCPSVDPQTLSVCHALVPALLSLTRLTLAVSAAVSSSMAVRVSWMRTVGRWCATASLATQVH